MPAVVEVLGCLGLLFWFVLLLGSALVLVNGPAEGTEEIDKPVLLATLVLGALGMAVSVALLLGKAWAYRVTRVVLVVLAVSCGALALFDEDKSRMAVWAVATAVFALLNALLGVESARAGFALPRRHLLTAPGWLTLSMGVAAVACAIWPLPTPMFGIWLPVWAVCAASIAFGAVGIWLGYGLIREHRRGHANLLLFLGSLIYSIGVVWDSNPGGKLPAGEAMTPEVANKGFLIGMLALAWPLWRIWLHWRRERSLTPAG